MDSQTMYELASQGPIRPANSKIPVLYGIKCVHFQSPNFTLGKLFFYFILHLIYINLTTTGRMFRLYGKQ